MMADAREGPSASGNSVEDAESNQNVFSYRQYRDERDLPQVMHLVDNELSEPYSIFTYRYFLHNWPSLCFLVSDSQHCFGTIVCKLDQHRERMRGYLAMLVVEKDYRHKGVGTQLVMKAISEMIKQGCQEVTLEAEVTNKGALKLYQNLGFIRDKRLHRYYLSGTDAFRLKLLLPAKIQSFTVPSTLPADGEAVENNADLENTENPENSKSKGNVNGFEDDTQSPCQNCACASASDGFPTA